MALKAVRDKIRFAIHLAEHCNLNCSGCKHFSPLALPELVSVDDFRRDFMRMGGIFSGLCEDIALLGGEPLLHPEVDSLMRIARENFPCGSINLLSNGILLHKCPPIFWNTCREYDIKIRVTPYPININISVIRELAGKYGADLQYWEGRAESSKTIFTIHPIDLTGSGNAHENFAACPQGNTSISLSAGRLYTCCFAAYVRHFNRKSRVKIPVSYDDYIDIHREDDGNNILRRLNMSIPLCRYCKPASTPKIIRWHISEGKIEEWL